MNICGIELKSNYAVLIVLDKNKNYLNLKLKKIYLENDELQGNIREFCNQFLFFLEQNQIEKIFIKKRAKKGNFASGAVSFKIEGLIQLNPFCEVQLVSSSAVNSFEKNNQILLPFLKKYQEQAYLTVLSSI